MSDLTRADVIRWVTERRAATSSDVATHFGVSVKVASAHLERAFGGRKLTRETNVGGSNGARYTYRPIPGPVTGLGLLESAARDRIADIDAEIARAHVERAALVAYIAALASTVHV
jgi:hypothetical protein